MSRILVLLGLGVALVLAIPRPALLPAVDPLSPAATLAWLQELREKEPAVSARSQQLVGLMEKVRRKAARTQAQAENPGAFLEALAQIKTAADGRQYAPGYRQRELTLSRVAKRAGDPLPWVERGPGNVAGRARAVVVDARDETRRSWWVASVGGGIWKTADAGASWVDKTPALTTLSTTCLVQAASDPQRFYAGTGMGFGRIVDLQGSGVWKSVDGGESWQQLPSTAQGQLLEAINRLAVDPQDADVVLACSNDQYSHLAPNEGTRHSAIFRTEDGGTSWEKVLDADLVFGTITDNRVQQILPNPLNFQTLYATVNEVGVIKSIDGGRNWFVSADDFALPGDIGNPPGGWYGLAGISVRTEIAIAPSDTSRLYAAVERPRGVADLYLSTDAGSSWRLVNDLTGDPNWFNAYGASGATGAYTAGWFDNTICVDPYDANVVFVGGVNLYRIEVDPVGATRTTVPMGWWIPNAAGIPVVHADHHHLLAVPREEQTHSFWLLDANDGGLGVSWDGGITWVQQANMGTTQFYGADKRPGQSAYIGGMQDNGTWHSPAGSNSHSSWFYDIGGDGFEVAWNGADPALLLGGSQFGNLSRSTDGGATWQAIPDALAGSTAPFISKIANGKLDPDLVFTVGTGGVKRSDDFGLSWTPTPVAGHWLGHRPFDNVEISVADPQVVWISSRIAIDPASGLRGGVHRSTDGGLSFTEITEHLPGYLTEVSGIATHPFEPQTCCLLFAAAGTPKILRTRDGGLSWVDLSGFESLGEPSVNGFPDVAVFSLLVMPFDVDWLWAGTEIGLFESRDGGANWALADNGLPHVGVFQMSIVDDQVVVATQGRGIWSVTLPELAQLPPPQVTLAPRLHPLSLLPSGNVALRLDLRSVYDSTVVTLNGQRFAVLAANEAPLDTMLLYPVTQLQTVTASAASYLEERALRTPSRSVTAFPTVVHDRAGFDFESPSAAVNWTGTGFSIRSETEFVGRAIHTAHPYPTSTDLTWMLKIPIRVAQEDAFLRWSDVVLVEEGVDPDYTDPEFFDYVIVEGTRDGVHWLPLIDGYDSRADPIWHVIYSNGLQPNGDSTSRGEQNMMVQHAVDLHDRFAPGEMVFLRFRLHSDPLAVAWGWAIDDVYIQSASLGVEGEGTEEETPPLLRTALLPNLPNPFNPSTTLRYTLAEPARVDLRVYNLQGERVCTLVGGLEQAAGPHSIQWHGIDDAGHRVASGVYLYRLQAGRFTQSRKMILLR